MRDICGVSEEVALSPEQWARHAPYIDFTPMFTYMSYSTPPRLCSYVMYNCTQVGGIILPIDAQHSQLSVLPKQLQTHI